MKALSAMKNGPFLIAACLCCIATSAEAKQPMTAAVFDFSFDDTSLQGEVQGQQADEQHRLAELNTELRDKLVESGCCTIADLGIVAEMNVRTCNGCDLDLARKASAQISVTGWVQKVSNLILNINLVVRDVGTGQVISAGSVDLRGNTDESWTRGLSYLLRNRLHPSEWASREMP
jgi:hypothetical protein